MQIKQQHIKMDIWDIKYYTKMKPPTCKRRHRSFNERKQTTPPPPLKINTTMMIKQRYDDKQKNMVPMSLSMPTTPTTKKTTPIKNKKKQKKQYQSSIPIIKKIQSKTQPTTPTTPINYDEYDEMMDDYYDDDEYEKNNGGYITMNYMPNTQQQQNDNEKTMMMMDDDNNNNEIRLIQHDMTKKQQQQQENYEHGQQKQKSGFITSRQPQRHHQHQQQHQQQQQQQQQHRRQDEMQQQQQQHNNNTQQQNHHNQENEDPDKKTYAVDQYKFNFWRLLDLEYEISDFDPYEFIANIPPQDTLPLEHQVNTICIPQRSIHAPKMTLVLDLDETLVHCSTQPMPNPDFVFPVVFKDTKYQVYVRRRPHFDEFLRVVAKYFEVVVFTASHQVYADRLLNLLDKQRYISHRVFRDSCVLVDGNYLKDLCVLGRNLAHLAIIDNSPQAFAYQIHNGIPIFSWYDDPSDTELLKMLPFLIQLSQVDDVRPVIRDKFRFFEVIHQYKRRQNPYI